MVVALEERRPVGLEGREPMVLDRVSVFISTDDAVSRAGITAQLRGAAGVDVVDESRATPAAVAVVVADLVDEDVALLLRSLR